MNFTTTYYLTEEIKDDNNRVINEDIKEYVEILNKRLEKDF